MEDVKKKLIIVTTNPSFNLYDEVSLYLRNFYELFVEHFEIEEWHLNSRRKAIKKHKVIDDSLKNPLVEYKHKSKRKIHNILNKKSVDGIFVFHTNFYHHVGSISEQAFRTNNITFVNHQFDKQFCPLCFCSKMWNSFKEKRVIKKSSERIKEAKIVSYYEGQTKDEQIHNFRRSFYIAPTSLELGKSKPSEKEDNNVLAMLQKVEKKHYKAIDKFQQHTGFKITLVGTLAKNVEVENKNIFSINNVDKIKKKELFQISKFFLYFVENNIPINNSFIEAYTNGLLVVFMDDYKELDFFIQRDLALKNKKKEVSLLSKLSEEDFMNKSSNNIIFAREFFNSDKFITKWLEVFVTK